MKRLNNNTILVYQYPYCETVFLAGIYYHKTCCMQYYLHLVYFSELAGFFISAIHWGTGISVSLERLHALIANWDYCIRIYLQWTYTTNYGIHPYWHFMIKTILDFVDLPFIICSNANKSLISPGLSFIHKKSSFSGKISFTGCGGHAWFHQQRKKQVTHLNMQVE